MAFKSHRFFRVMALLMLSALACSLPGFSAPTPMYSDNTPDLTRTAIFGTTATDLPAVTMTYPPGEEPTATTEDGATLTPTSATTSTTIPYASPTTSYAGPGMRSGASIAAKKLNSAPNIDGDVSEWSLSLYPVANVVYGGANRTGESDLYATVMVGWDNDNLYLGVRVKDSKFVQNATGAYLYRGDSIEILLDTLVSADFYYRGLTGDDYQLGMSPGSLVGSKSPEAYLWYPAGLAGPRGQVDIGVLPTGQGYQIEVAIPWSIFGVSPSTGQHFGFAFSVSDNDNSSTNVQQSMISNVSTRALTDPTTWGDLTLVGP